MEPNLTAHYLGIAPDHARLSDQAQRGWLVEQAVATQPKRIGGALIATGQRMQGVPKVTPMTV